MANPAEGAVSLQDDAAYLSTAINNAIRVRSTVMRIDQEMCRAPALGYNIAQAHANIQELLKRDLHDAVQKLDYPPVNITTALGSCFECGLMRLFSTVPI